MNQATQVQHGWRATARTAVAVLVALLSVIPVLLTTTGVDQTVYGAQVLAVTALITRLMALPAVDAVIETYAPWLAARPVR
ncbi:hypothetical protein D5S18_02935 [Nocardia panacis]|uniref:Uncharacterized protein n=1 Tax=Nocardia panacis TaxID=2340916 RepID=A0A3A4KPB8_9NOCA|nr:hypothetical protein [Nocardia panacis]RJO79302.1 hypothetical protein D5S18_02935 [Nocardia panacis]